MKPKRVLLCIALLLLAGAAAALGYRFYLAMGRQRFVLSDGTPCELLQVSLSRSNHVLLIGSMSERLLARLPGSLGAKHKRITVKELNTAENEMVLVFHLPAMVTNRDLRLDVDFGNGLSSSRYALGTYYLADSTSVKVIRVPSWPRRQKVLRGRVYERSQGLYHLPKQAGEITIRNPAHRTYAKWKPEPLPTVRRVGGVEFVLRDVKAFLDRDRETMVSFKIEVPTSGGDQWSVETANLSDATGNNESGLAKETWHYNGVIEGNARVRVPRGEDVVKLTLEMLRLGALASNATRSVTVSNIAVGEWRKHRANGIWTTNTTAGEFVIRYSAGENVFRCRVNAELIQLPNGEIVARMAETGRRLAKSWALTEVIADGNRRLPFNDREWFTVPPDVQSLTVTMGVPERVFVEYLIDAQKLSVE